MRKNRCLPDHSLVSGQINTFDKARLFCCFSFQESGIRLEPMNIGFLCHPGFLLAALTPEANKRVAEIASTVSSKVFCFINNKMIA